MSYYNICAVTWENVHSTCRLAQFDQSSLDTLWIAKDLLSLYVDMEDLDQTNDVHVDWSLCRL